MSLADRLGSWVLSMGALALSLSASTARAQEAPPDPLPPQPAPPPGYGQPPPGYGQPPPGYGQPPPGYGQPPPGYEQPPPGYAPPGYYGAPYGYGLPAPTLAPKKLDYDEGDPVPPGYRVVTRMRKGLVIGGAATFGGAYVLTLLTASILTEFGDEHDPLFIPVAGPFITIGTANAEGSGTFALLLDGVVQAAGVGMFIGGLAAPEKILLRNDVEGRLEVVPMVGPGLAGLGLSGTM